LNELQVDFSGSSHTVKLNDELMLDVKDTDLLAEIPHLTSASLQFKLKNAIFRQHLSIPFSHKVKIFLKNKPFFQFRSA